MGRKRSIASDNNDDGDDGGNDDKKPKLDLTYVEKPFYICETCDDIFLEKKHLNIHIKHIHQEEESAPARPEASSTPKPSCEGEKNASRIHRPAPGALSQNSKKSQITNKNEDKENVSSVAKSKRSQNNIVNILMKSDVKTLNVKDSSQKLSKEASKKHSKNVGADKASKIKNNTNALKPKNASHTQESSKETPKKQKKTSGVGKEESPKKSPPKKELDCSFCDKKCNGSNNFKNHILSHFYAKFDSIIPNSKPFACPNCGAESRDKITTIRHFAFTHKKLYELTSLTEEKMKQMMKS